MTTQRDFDIICDIFKIECKSKEEYDHLINKNLSKMEKYGT